MIGWLHKLTGRRAGADALQVDDDGFEVRVQEMIVGWDWSAARHGEELRGGLAWTRRGAEHKAELWRQEFRWREGLLP